MTEKILTIVVPVYNTEKYLNKCLDSFLVENEQLNALEVLVIIDGSPDNSLEIANNYANRFPDTFKVVYKENGGHGSTINTGLKIAKGKYFKVLDSDDWFDTISLNLFITKLKDLDVDIVLTNFVKEYNDSQEYIKQNSIEENKLFSFKDFNFSNYYANLFSMASSTYKLRLLKEINLQLPEKIFYDDNVLIYKPLYYAKNFMFYSLPLYRYYLCRDNQSSNIKANLKNIEHFMTVFKILIADYLNNKNNISDELSLYMFKIMKEWINFQYILRNELPYMQAIVEIRKWDYLIKKLDINFQKTKTIILYRRFPYFIFRFLVKKFKKM